MARRWGIGGTSATERLPHSPALTRIAAPVVVVSYALAIAATVVHLHGRSPAVIAAATAALLVAAAGTAWTFLSLPDSHAQALAALTVTGLGGALLFALVPSAPSFLIICIGLGGLGMRLAPAPALICGLVVAVTANAGFRLGAGLSAANLASQNVGMAFVLAVGAFTRSARISQASARAAQARAEDLLAQLQASQAAQAEAAALTERTRLAREIHDILAHALSGLVLALDTMELLGRQGGSDPVVMARMLEQVTRAQRIARDGLADTRRAVSALRGDEMPGPALLDRLVRETAETTGIKAVLTVTGEQRPLPPEIGLALYRTAQETMTNTAKYAGRDGRAELRLTYTDDDVELAVEDTRSQDAAPARAGLTFGGHGLTGMRERAELLGGRLTAGPTETGFRVLLQLPAVPAADPGGSP